MELSVYNHSESQQFFSGLCSNQQLPNTNIISGVGPNGSFLLFYIYLIYEAFHVVRPSIIKSNWKKYFRKKTRKWYPLGKINLYAKTSFVPSSTDSFLGSFFDQLVPKFQFNWMTMCWKQHAISWGPQSKVKSNNSILIMEKHFLAPK